MNMCCYANNAIVIVFNNFHQFVLEQENAQKSLFLQMCEPKQILVVKTMISPTSTDRPSQTFRFSNFYSKRVGKSGRTAYTLYLV